MGWREMEDFADKLAAQKPSRQRAYLGSLLPNHVKSGNLEKYYQRLTDFNFLMAKIQHPEFGVQALIDDFDLVDASKVVTSPEYNPATAKALNLIQSVLWMSGDILDRDRTKLAEQLLGRLLYFEMPEIQTMLKVAKQWKAAPWLRPLTPCLTPPRRGLLRTIEGHSKSVKAVAVTADGKRAISGSRDKTLKVWDLTTGNELFTLNGHSYSVYAVAVTPDGKRVISGSDDNTLKVWDLTTGEELFTLKGHSNSVNAVAVTADGKQAISGSDDNTLKVWDLTTGNELFTLNGHSNSIHGLAVTPDGKRAISGAWDNTLKVWDLTTGKELFTLEGHSNSVNAVAVIADGKQVISGAWDETLKVWDLTTGKELFTLEGRSGLVNAVAVTPDGKRAISSSWDNTLKVWDLTTRKELFPLNGHSGSVNAVAITADGKRAISGAWDATLKVWDLTTGKERFPLNGHSDWVKAVAITADGKLAISGSDDKTLKVWDLTTQKELFTLKGHSNSVNAVAVTADGKRAISGSRDNNLKVWDLTTGKEEFTLKGHSDSVKAVAITLDGNLAISGSRDKTLKVWDLSSGNVIASFTGQSEITSCAIAPDGVTIVAGDTSSRVYFLRLEGMEALTYSSPLLTPISTAYPPEFQQLLREKTKNFAGREFVFSAISNFLNSHSRGYFTIVGTPGCGKSSILAQYVTAHPRSIYYNAGIEGKNRSHDFLASVCTQLIDKYLAANGETSEIVKLKSQIQNLESDDGNWFLSLLLQKISDKLDASQKLIIVIDTLDAIALTSQPPSTNLFYLPRYLCDRTYFILGRRPFLREKSGLLIEAPSQTLDLRDYPAQNREDVLKYIQQYLSTAPEFCQQLATLGENNFMYLSQMLPAITENLHPDSTQGEKPLIPSQIPPGLAAYYQNHWQRMGGDGLSAVELSVLKVLVESKAGLSVTAISEMIDEDEYDVEKALDNWIEFLNQQEIGGEICYSLYHDSFRDWLGKQSILE